MSEFLLKFIESLPKRVVFEKRPYSEVRREFLSFIQKIDTRAFCLLYLAGERSDNSVELVLTNSSLDPSNEIYPTTRRLQVPVSLLQAELELDGLIIELGIQDWLKRISRANFKPYITVLTGAQYSTAETTEPFVEPGIVGVIFAFFPPGFALDTEKKVALYFAKRLLIGDIVNSRLERSTLAANEILQLIRGEKDFFKSVETICDIFNRYTQSQCTLAFKIEANNASFQGSAGQIDGSKKRLLSDSLPKLQFVQSTISSKRVTAGFTSALPNLRGEDKEVCETSWLAAPCIIDAVKFGQSESSHSSEISFLIFVLLGKTSPHYLGRSYSTTDIGITKKLCSIISTHIPAAISSSLLQDVSDVFFADTREPADLQPSQDPAERLMQVATKLGLGIKSIVYLDKGEEGEDAEPELHASPTLPGFAEEVLIQKLASLEFKKKSSEVRLVHIMGEDYLTWDISTDYRAKRFLLISVGTSELPAYLFRVLKSFVENYYLSLRSEDFYFQQTATLAQIRHAVRGPLAAAMSLLELMASRFSRYRAVPTKFAKIMDSPTMREWIPDALLYTQQAYIIADSARYLLGAIKPEDIRWGDIDMVHLVRSVIDVMSSEISRRDIRVTFDPPTTDRTFIISADRMLLWTVIFNLIDNAVKYSYIGRRITVRISLEDNGKKWRFSVTNIGVPIPEEEKKRIFQPWTRSRVKDVGRRRPGTGLGLPVSRYILHAHDPEALLDVESNLISESDSRNRAARTEFFFTFPMKGKVQHEAAEIARLSS